MDSATTTARWKLVLGGAADSADAVPMPPDYGPLDQVLTDLYDAPEKGRGGLGNSAPRVSRWLGDIRTYFPTEVVAVMQHDAMDRLGLNRLLLEPEVMRTVQPDVHLVGTLLSLARAMPAKVKDTARQVVRQVVQDLEKRLANPLRQAVKGALSRAVRNSRPRLAEVNWGASPATSAASATSPVGAPTAPPPVQPAELRRPPTRRGAPKRCARASPTPPFRPPRPVCSSKQCRRPKRSTSSSSPAPPAAPRTPRGRIGS